MDESGRPAGHPARAQRVPGTSVAAATPATRPGQLVRQGVALRDDCRTRFDGQRRFEHEVIGAFLGLVCQSRYAVPSLPAYAPLQLPNRVLSVAATSFPTSQGMIAPFTRYVVYLLAPVADSSVAGDGYRCRPRIRDC